MDSKDLPVHRIGCRWQGFLPFDAGGPFAIKGGNGRFQVAGIMSWGIGCGEKNRPGVSTRISEFKAWIIRNTNY